MTTRLYYRDALAETFSATVVGCERRGEGWAVTLDQTAFYPTSGGQPFDTGTIDDVPVVDVVDDEEADEIRHLTGRPLPVGAVVAGRIAWPRRFDHMQQHTGQHVLSAAFERTAAAATVSFHLGGASATIDLSREVTPAEVAEAEADANATVWADRAVTVRFVSEEEAARLPLRKAPLRRGTLRLIEIEGCDVSACGGTHVGSTGRIGLVAVTGWERFKGATRVTFVCGGRALRSHGALRDIVAEATRLLSVSGADLVSAIARGQGDLKAASRLARRLQEEVASARAAALIGRAEAIGGRSVVLRHEAGWDAAAIKLLALAVVSAPGQVAALVGDGAPVPVVIARSADVSIDAGGLVKALTGALGGRGGGRPEAAQGGVPAAPEAILAWVREALASHAS